MTFLCPSWCSLDFWRGHLTIPKRAQRIARNLEFKKTLKKKQTFVLKSNLQAQFLCWRFCFWVLWRHHLSDLVKDDLMRWPWGHNSVDIQNPPVQSSLLRRCVLGGHNIYLSTREIPFKELYFTQAKFLYIQPHRWPQEVWLDVVWCYFNTLEKMSNKDLPGDSK